MNSKKYLLKLFSIGFLFFIIIIFIFYIVHNKYDNNSLHTKEYLVKNNKPKIIFSGDSRAERQLNPILANKLLEFIDGDVVNIAVSSGDPLMIEELIAKYPDSFKDSIVVISISQNQLNDGSKSIGYFSNSMISKMSFFEQITTFSANYFNTLLKYYMRNIFSLVQEAIGYKRNIEDFKSTFGFNPIDSIFDENKFNIDELKKNSWYENYYNKQIKIKLLKAALFNIKRNVKQLYVYIPPLSPKVMQIIKNSNYYNIELDMEKSLQVICHDLNINYKSYSFDERFDNKDFYDPFHLNKLGANIFTTILLKDIEMLK